MLFPAWGVFYEIVGSASGALAGLMFVVIALVADARGATEAQLDAFGTPTVIHFGAALLLSALSAAPWPGLTSFKAALALYGAAGCGYMIVVVRRTSRLTEYAAVFEDWLFHALLPLVAYGAVLIAALGLRLATMLSLFTIGGAALLLLFAGIHNAWDTVTYILVNRWQAHRRSPGSPGRPREAHDEDREERSL